MSELYTEVNRIPHSLPHYYIYNDHNVTWCQNKVGIKVSESLLSKKWNATASLQEEVTDGASGKCKQRLGYGLTEAKLTVKTVYRGEP